MSHQNLIWERFHRCWASKLLISLQLVYCTLHTGVRTMVEGPSRALLSDW